MIVYKDRAFCAHSNCCGNKECVRRITDKDREGAQKLQLPFSLMDLKNNQCGYIQIEPEREES